MSELDEPRCEESAGRRVGARTSSGWRVGKVLRVNGAGVLYEGSRGQGDAMERGLLHIPSPEVERSLPLRAEFQRGAWAAARLSHPRSFVPLDESTTADGLPCIAWPWPGGRPLAEYMDAGGGLSREDALRILEQILDVLEQSHATAVIHGAIDPWAIWQTTRRSARVLLFAFPPGIHDPALYDPRGLVVLRRDGFQAPELAESADPPTAASDLYSLAQVVASAMVGPVAPGLGRILAYEKLMLLGVDEPLAAVLALALARVPEDRYSTAIAMRKDVQRLVAGEAPRLEAAGATGGQFDAAFAGESTSSIVLDLRFREKAAARARMMARGKGPPSAVASQAGGNVLLAIAMVVVVAAAAFAIWHERQQEETPKAPLAVPAQR